MVSMRAIVIVTLVSIGLCPQPVWSQQKDSSIATAAHDSMGGRGPDPSVLTPTVIAEGRRIFRGAGGCAGCHGSRLEGGPIAPTLRAHRWRNGDGSYAMILHVVSAGVPGTAMVAHPGGIDDRMAGRVSAYIWAVSHGKAEP
jgi:mono/diheme cytochrome c family protein